MKKPPRKPARKRPARPTQIDDELAELATVLDERRLEAGSVGWFELPWYDSSNACDLALETFERRWPRAHGWGAGISEAHNLVVTRPMSAQGYHEATDFLCSTIRGELGEGTTLLRAALRCYQLAITHNHGIAPNEILRPIDDFDEDLVERWRCKDAIGVFPQLNNDADDRRRRAFSIAWKRGLFHAAYAIGPTRRAT